MIGRMAPTRLSLMITLALVIFVAASPLAALDAVGMRLLAFARVSAVALARSAGSDGEGSPAAAT